MNPPVFADPHGRCERAPAIGGHRERDVADVSRVDMSPRRVNGAIAAGGDRRLAAVADTAGERAGAVGTRQASEEQLRQLRAGDAIRRCGLRRVVLVLGMGHRRAPAAAGRQLAMIQPECHHIAVAGGGDRFPAAIARRLTSGNARRSEEGVSAIVGSRGHETSPCRILRRPDDDDRGIAAVARNQRHAWRLFSTNVRITRRAIDPDRSAERAPAVPAGAGVDVRHACCRRRAPGDGRELADCGQRGVGVGA